MNEREKIEQSIAALEAQRTMLSDPVVEPAIAALKKQLKALEPQKSTRQQRQDITVRPRSSFRPGETMVAPPYAAALVGSEPPRRAGLPDWPKQ